MINNSSNANDNFDSVTVPGRVDCACQCNGSDDVENIELDTTSYISTNQVGQLNDI